LIKNINRLFRASLDVHYVRAAENGKVAVFNVLETDEHGNAGKLSNHPVYALQSGGHFEALVYAIGAQGSYR
jgi:hypothetical protein